jgi:hypothetical protein
MTIYINRYIMAAHAEISSVLISLGYARHYSLESSGFWLYSKDLSENVCDGLIDDDGTQPSSNHPQGYKFHIGFHDDDVGTVLKAILPILHEHNIDHKIVSTMANKQQLDSNDPGNTQRGKHIAMYVAKITPKVLLQAQEGNDEPLKKRIGKAKLIYQLLDINMGLLIRRGQIQKINFWSAEGLGTDKYVGDSRSGMVGYRLGAFCSDEMYTYNESGTNLIEIEDARNLYKSMAIFQQVTITNDTSPIELHQKEVKELRATLRSRRELVGLRKKLALSDYKIVKRKLETDVLKLVLDILENASEKLEGSTNVMTNTSDYLNVYDYSELEHMKESLKESISHLDRLNGMLENLSESLTKFTKR